LSIAKLCLAVNVAIKKALRVEAVEFIGSDPELDVN
jgi:hypothetical protein